MSSWTAIFLTLLVAIILALLPMPEWTAWLRPAWVLMVLMYWAIMTPNRVGVGVAWAVGLLLDLLYGTLLGEHALAFTIVIYFVNRMHIRLRMFPLLQQGFCVFLFVLLYQLILYCVQGFIGQLPASQLYWLSSVTTLVLWPWFFVVMRDCHRWFNVA